MQRSRGMNSRGVNRTMKQKMHAQIRSKERLGFMLTASELKALSSRVRGGTFLRAGVQGREVWRVPVRGIDCDVVFDPVRGHIVSFLPLTKVATDGPASGDVERDARSSGEASQGADLGTRESSE